MTLPSPRMSTAILGVISRENPTMPSRFTVALLLFVTVSPVLQATEPTLRALDVRGLRVGGTTTLVIDGDDLGTTPRLLLPFAAKQTLKPGSTDKKATFDVTLDGEVTPG